jgi:hypothetical protein
VFRATGHHESGRSDVVLEGYPLVRERAGLALPPWFVVRREEGTAVPARPHVRTVSHRHVRIGFDVLGRRLEGCRRVETLLQKLRREAKPESISRRSHPLTLSVVHEEILPSATPAKRSAAFAYVFAAL